MTLNLLELGPEDKVLNFDNKFRKVKWSASSQSNQMNPRDYILLH